MTPVHALFLLEFLAHWQWESRQNRAAPYVWFVKTSALKVTGKWENTIGQGKEKGNSWEHVWHILVTLGNCRIRYIKVVTIPHYCLGRMQLEEA